MDSDPGDLALLVDHDERALGHAAGVAHAEEVHDLALRIEVREQGIADAELFRPGGERVAGIPTDAPHLRVRGAEPRPRSLIPRRLRPPRGTQRDRAGRP